MRKKMALAVVIVSISFFLSLTLENAWAELKIGDPAPGFMLGMTEDKPVSYNNDYYGKYHLACPWAFPFHPNKLVAVLRRYLIGFQAGLLNEHQ